MGGGETQFSTVQKYCLRCLGPGCKTGFCSLQCQPIYRARLHTYSPWEETTRATARNVPALLRHLSVQLQIAPQRKGLVAIRAHPSGGLNSNAELLSSFAGDFGIQLQTMRLVRARPKTNASETHHCTKVCGLHMIAVLALSSPVAIV